MTTELKKETENFLKLAADPDSFDKELFKRSLVKGLRKRLGTLFGQHSYHARKWKRLEGDTGAGFNCDAALVLCMESEAKAQLVLKNVKICVLELELELGDLWNFSVYYTGYSEIKVYAWPKE